MQRKHEPQSHLKLTSLMLSTLMLSTCATVSRAQGERPMDAPPPPGAPVSLPPDNLVDGRPPTRMNSAAIAANGNYLYVLKGNTLFRLRLSDMATLNQRDLPIMGRMTGQNTVRLVPGGSTPPNGNAAPPSGAVPPNGMTPPVPAGPDTTPSDLSVPPPPRDAEAPPPDRGPAGRRPRRQPRTIAPGRPQAGSPMLPTIPGGWE